MQDVFDNQFNITELLCKRLFLILVGTNLRSRVSKVHMH